MDATALVYSSHSRSHVLHHDLIVQRALAGRANHRILLLPMSELVQDGNERVRQEREVENFRWYLRQFEPRGLEVVPFFWSSGLKPSDVDILWRFLEDSEVVLLGGGGSAHGLARYKDLGARFAGDPDHMGKLLRRRRERGLFTVGFSAGADQLMEQLFRSTTGTGQDTAAFGVVKEMLVTLHHDPSRNHELQHAARQRPSARVFGLPNDSGLLVTERVRASGDRVQIIDFVVDTSWDAPQDGWHIRTRAGAPIDHLYADGRHWGFRSGDQMIRTWSADGQREGCWIRSGGQLLDYVSQGPSSERLDALLAA